MCTIEPRPMLKSPLAVNVVPAPTVKVAPLLVVTEDCPSLCGANTNNKTSKAIQNLLYGMWQVNLGAI